MSEITLVTGNHNKLVELQAVFPDSITLRNQSVDIPEIQSLDLQEIVRAKLMAAYQVIGGPVIVEDISAELENLNGLPGPFVKYFEQKLGKDALYKLSAEGTKVIIRCTMGYYDGVSTALFEGTMQGTISRPVTDSGFGFDIVIIPEGFDKTLAELGPTVKNTISHRFKAAQQMADYILNFQ